MQADPFLNVVLYQPEIPQNTGNIGRTCVALQAKLWIVRPTGFRLDAASVQRAGLDYWQFLNWQSVDSWSELEGMLPPRGSWYYTKHADTRYTQVRYGVGDWLIFGSESNGLPPSVRERHRDRCLSLPMPGPVRSLNLAVSAGIAMYEAYRQCHS